MQDSKAQHKNRVITSISISTNVKLGLEKQIRNTSIVSTVEKDFSTSMTMYLIGNRFQT